jgi:hypothetical protein
LSFLRQGVKGHAGFAQHPAPAAPLGIRPLAITEAVFRSVWAHTASVNSGQRARSRRTLVAATARRMRRSLPPPVSRRLRHHQRMPNICALDDNGSGWTACESHLPGELFTVVPNTVSRLVAGPLEPVPDLIRRGFAGESLVDGYQDRRVLPTARSSAGHAPGKYPQAGSDRISSPQRLDKTQNHSHDHGRSVDQARDGRAVCGCAICLAACIKAVSLCCDQQQRSWLWRGRDRASRHRPQHRSGEWRSHSA